MAFIAFRQVCGSFLLGASTSRPRMLISWCLGKRAFSIYLDQERFTSNAPILLRFEEPHSKLARTSREARSERCGGTGWGKSSELDLFNEIFKIKSGWGKSLERWQRWQD